MVDESALAARAEDFDLEHIPPEVLFSLSASTCRMTGWKLPSSAGREPMFVWCSRTIRFGEIFTDTGTWDELDELLRTRWRHPYGGQVKSRRGGVRCRRRRSLRHRSKLLRSQDAPACVRRQRTVRRRPGFQMAKGKTIANRLALIGVDTIKNM